MLSLALMEREGVPEALGSALADPPPLSLGVVLVVLEAVMPPVSVEVKEGGAVPQLLAVAEALGT